ncbi:unnamed protein product, partial [Staurois parvus]
MKGTRGISWGPLLTPGPLAVPEFLNGQSAPGLVYKPSARVHIYVVRYIACDSYKNRTSFLCKSHAICVRCDWSLTFCMAQIAPH